LGRSQPSLVVALLLCFPVVGSTLTPGIALSAVPTEGTRDEEREDDRSEDLPEASPEGQPEARPQSAPPSRRLSAREESETSVARESAGDFVPATRALVLDLGGEVVTLGGYAFPKIPLKGTTTNRFKAHGLGGAFRLNYDFEATGLDWRVKLGGALPGYLGLGATVGIRKNMGPWQNPRVFLRGGGGLELMLAGGIEDVVFLVPVFVGDGEASIEYEVLANQFVVGAALEVGVRYGLPLGGGFQIGSFIRAAYLF